MKLSLRARDASGGPAIWTWARVRNPIDETTSVRMNWGKRSMGGGQNVRRTDCLSEWRA